MILGILRIFLLIFVFNTAFSAEPISGNYAILKLLDKTTNKVNQKKIEVNSLIKWDSLEIIIYACYTTPPEEIPENYVLIEVLDTLISKKKHLYKGWMISSSPDVTPLEHPIYDLWLVDCIIDNV